MLNYENVKNNTSAILIMNHISVYRHLYANVVLGLLRWNNTESVKCKEIKCGDTQWCTVIIMLMVFAPVLVCYGVHIHNISTVFRWYCVSADGVLHSSLHLCCMLCRPVQGFWYCYVVK